MTRLKAKATEAKAPVRSRSKPNTEAVAAPTTEEPKTGNVKASKAMKDLVAEFAINNTAKNMHDRKANKAKKDLGPLMAEAGFDADDGGFDHKVTIDGNVKTFHAEIITPVGQAVDPKKLFDLVGEEEFLKYATITQKSVTDAFGNNVLNKCLVDVTGDAALSIKEKK